MGSSEGFHVALKKAAFSLAHQEWAFEEGVVAWNHQSPFKALVRGNVRLQISPIISLNNYCRVFYQLESIQTFAYILGDDVWPSESCIHFTPFTFLSTEVLLEDLSTNLIGTGVSTFVVIILLLFFLDLFDVGFDLLENFTSLSCPFFHL